MDIPRGGIAATRRRRGWRRGPSRATRRSDAAAATWIVRRGGPSPSRKIAATPRPRRKFSARLAVQVQREIKRNVPQIEEARESAPPLAVEHDPPVEENVLDLDLRSPQPSRSIVPSLAARRRRSALRGVVNGRTRRLTTLAATAPVTTTPAATQHRVAGGSSRNMSMALCRRGLPGGSRRTAGPMDRLSDQLCRRQTACDSKLQGGRSRRVSGGVHAPRGGDLRALGAARRASGLSCA